MKLRNFQSRVVGYYQTGNCITLRSKPGRGKTSVISQAPAIIGQALGKRMGYSYISAPTLSPADAIGYLIPGKDAKGHMASMFTRPFWWYTAEGHALEDYDGGIIFIDEEDKADPDIKKIIGEMGYSGRCGPHIIPKGWVVWMAGNYRGDRSGSTRELDHLINRRCEIDIQDDMEGWQDFAVRKGLNGVAIAFAERQANVVFDSEPPKVQGPWCTPRSFVECIEHLQCFMGSDGRLPIDSAAMEDAKGYIGQAASSALMTFIRLEHELPSLADILSDPMGCRLPNRADAQLLVAYSLAQRADKSNFDPMIKYADRLPQEFAVLFADAAIKRDSALIDTPAMDDWCQRNGSLMRTISRYKAKRTA